MLYNMSMEDITRELNEQALKLEGHDHEIGSLKHRVSNVESKVELIAILKTQIELLTLKVDNQIEQSKSSYAVLNELKDRPAEDAKATKTTIRTAIISGIISFILGVILKSVGS